jgi:hypothetical protein
MCKYQSIFDMHTSFHSLTNMSSLNHAYIVLLCRRAPSQTRFSVQKMADTLSLTQRLESREEVHPSELDNALETRARMHRAGAPYSPVYPNVGRLFPGTYYLNGIDSKWTRTYSRVPLDAKMEKHGTSLAPPIVLRLSKRDTLSIPVTGKLEVLTSAAEGSSDKLTEARRRVACVITGVSAGLPGGGGRVFGPENLTRLVTGDQCITAVNGRYASVLLCDNIFQ